MQNLFSRRKRDWLWPLVIATLIFWASSRSHLVSPDLGLEHLDKIVHFGVFGLLATLLVRLGRGWRSALVALMVTSAYGVSDEWHQSFVPGRSVEVADWLADTLGGALAVALYTSWPWYRRRLETPLRRSQRRVENAAPVATVSVP